jgi:small subunit ribosomal protein S20
VANIKQQKKRNRRSLKQRDTNIRYRSTVRSGMKRLSAAVDAGEAITPEQAAEMAKTIDRAAANGALHKNTASRRKARVARLVAQSAA